MRVRAITSVCAAALLVTAADSAAGQQRPLVTEDPETVGTGLVSLFFAHGPRYM